MTIQEKYNKHINGEISKEKFLYESRRDPGLSQYITNSTSYDDAVKILKNRGIITEARKKATSLTLDQSNPYEYKKGLDYELELCERATPNLLPEDYAKAQKKVLSNLAKDPNFYTKTLAGIKPDGDLASDSELGDKSKRSDVYYALKKDNIVDKKNGVKEVSKLEKSNVKDTLGNKEKAKKKVPKGVEVMTVIPKKHKGVKVMDIPGKEKIIKTKLKESKKTDLLSLLKEIESTPMEPEDEYTYDNTMGGEDDAQSGFNYNDIDNPLDPVRANENIPQTNASFLPFGSVKPGMQATDDSGQIFKVLATGDYNAVKRYDVSKAMSSFLSSDPTGIDGNQLVALIDREGNTVVRIYGTGGVYVDNSTDNDLDQASVAVQEYSNDEDLKNKEKAFIQARMRNDQEKVNSLRESGNLESDIAGKSVPQDREAQAEAKAAILVAITKARLNDRVDLDNEVITRAGFIWVKVNIGNEAITSEQLKALCSDKRFKAINPLSDTEVTLVFDKQ